MRIPSFGQPRRTWGSDRQVRLRTSGGDQACGYRHRNDIRRWASFVLYFSASVGVFALWVFDYWDINPTFILYLQNNAVWLLPLQAGCQDGPNLQYIKFSANIVRVMHWNGKGAIEIKNPE